MMFKSFFFKFVAASLLSWSSLASAQIYGVYRELWFSLGTTNLDLSTLTNTTLNPKCPNTPSPSFTNVFGNLETDANTTLIGYGQRLRTFVVAPLNGLYTFWIASDDLSNLYLSTDETPENRVLIARVDGATN